MAHTHMNQEFAPKAPVPLGMDRTMKLFRIVGGNLNLEFPKAPVPRGTNLLFRTVSKT